MKEKMAKKEGVSTTVQHILKIFIKILFFTNVDPLFCPLGT